VNCPICNCSKIDKIREIKSDVFDDSRLYKNIVILKCSRCGHVFNKLTKKDIDSLMIYYNEEYAPSNLSYSCGDRPGSDTKDAGKRYKQLYAFLSRYITKKSKILDVGCAMGGFLRFLRKKGYENLYGIDPIKEYVNASDNENIKVGDVSSVPFESNSFDVVILDQVLEHVFDLKLALSEIKRVLIYGGLCCVSVPNEQQYDDVYFYLMKEHVQHFNYLGLKRLANLNGFEVINNNKTKSKMIGTMDLPNLSVILKPSGTTYCWGIGREFMYKYANTRLKNLSLTLVDDTPEKQKQTFKGMRVYSSDVLQYSSKDSFLIITASMHKNELIKKAKRIGYRGEIIEI